MIYLKKDRIAQDKLFKVEETKVYFFTLADLLND